MILTIHNDLQGLIISCRMLNDVCYRDRVLTTVLEEKLEILLEKIFDESNKIK